jgi:transposase
MAMADRAGLPVAIHVASASPPEVPRVEATLTTRFVEGRPARLLGDKADDSDPLEATLATQGLAMMAPHRAKRKAPNTQEGRPLRRDNRRWQVARRFAWRHSFRRVLGRHDDPAENSLGLVHLGCLVILLRWC